MRTRAIHAGIAVAVLGAELLVATVFAPVVFVRSFLSDYLVVMLLYHAVRAATSLSPRRVAVGVFAFACIIEGSQYFHLVDVLGLRHGSLLAIALGNSWSVPDLLMYALGCLTSWFLDTRLLSRPRLRPQTPSAPGA